MVEQRQRLWELENLIANLGTREETVTDEAFEERLKQAEREGHGYSTPSLHRITAGQGEDGGEGRLEYEQNSKKENQTWEEAKAKEPR